MRAGIYHGHRTDAAGPEAVYFIPLPGFPGGRGATALEPEPLSPRFDLCNHSPDGLSWGYGGSGPAQTALAILAHYFAVADRGADIADEELRETLADARAIALHQAFKWHFVAPAKGDLVITTRAIGEWLQVQAIAEAQQAKAGA